MSIYNTIQRHLIRKEISFVCGKQKDDSNKYIEVITHNDTRQSEIDLVFLFDGTGHLLEGIEVHERPFDTATNSTKLLSTKI